MSIESMGYIPNNEMLYYFSVPKKTQCYTICPTFGTYGNNTLKLPTKALVVSSIGHIVLYNSILEKARLIMSHEVPDVQQSSHRGREIETKWVLVALEVSISIIAF